jgi:hypothetical protein
VASFISWLDFSEADQRRVREMLQLFSDRDTVDDLGIGTVRDAISNTLFPGTSVIQTRARYYLFVPWIFQRAEQRHPRQIVAKAQDMERSLVEALRAGGDLEGLVGREAGKNVRTLPSAIYWGGLVRYGIFAARSMSIRQYGRHVARRSGDDDREDELAERKPSLWHREIPDPPMEFFRFREANFDFSAAEAEWLCERVLWSDADSGRESLLGVLVRDLRRGAPIPEHDLVWHAVLPSDTPTPLADLVAQGQRFSAAVQGAAVLYNLMLAEVRQFDDRDDDEATSVETYREWLDEWLADARAIGLVEWASRPEEFWNALLAYAPAVPARTRAFLDEWLGVLADRPRDLAASAEARACIRDREIAHKRGQARFANPKRLAEWRGYAGTRPLEFRWSQVQRLLRDIASGLPISAETEHALA